MSINPYTQAKQDLLKHEVEIVWEEDTSRLDYVREIVNTYPHRRRIKKWRGVGRRVGYSVVAPDAPNERGCLGGWLGFYRREFFLVNGDRDSDADGCYGSHGCPSEGVDPRTVRPGVPGQQTERAWNGSGQEASGTLLDLYPAGPILNLNGQRVLISWDRLAVVELGAD